MAGLIKKSLIFGGPVVRAAVENADGFAGGNFRPGDEFQKRTVGMVAVAKTGADINFFGRLIMCICLS